MKKIGAILLIFCMVMSIAMVPAYAYSTVTLTNAKLADGHADRLLGAYDHAEGELAPANIAAAMVSGNKTTSRLQLDAYGEWIEIDISDQAAGTYSVTIGYQSQGGDTTTLDFIVDGNLELRETPTYSSSLAEGVVLQGQIYVPSNVSGLKVKNIGSKAIQFKQIAITKVGDEDTSANIVFVGGESTYTYNNGTITRTPFVDYYDGRYREAVEGKYTVPCVTEVCGHESGYHHSEFQGTTLQTGGSWIRYDVSDLAEGTYEVVANVSAREGAQAKLSLDGVETQPVTLEAVEPLDASNFGAAYDQSLGKITISGTSQYLTLKNASEIVFRANTLTFVPSTPDEGGEDEGGDDEPFVITKDTEYTDFFAHDANAQRPSIDETFVNLNPSGEWVSYDISALEAGTYSLDVEYKSDTADTRNVRGLDFIVDGGLELRAYLSNRDGSEEAQSVGTIYIPEGAEELKIKNHGMYSVGIKSIAFTLVGTDDTSENILISAQNASSSYSDGAVVFTLMQDYYDTACKTYNASKHSVACNGTCGAYESGYHYPLTSDSVIGGERLTHHKNDWTRYDISDLKAGTYNVTLKDMTLVGSGVTLDVDGTQYVYELTSNGALDAVYSDFELGEITISEDSNYLKLINSGGNNYRVKWIEFAPVGEEGGEGGEDVGGDDVIESSTEITYTSDALGETSVDSLDGLNTVYVKVSMERPDKTEAINETIYIALYDGARLKSVNAYPVTEALRYENIFTVSGLNSCKLPEVKTFVWENLTSMIPVSESVSKTVEYTQQYLGNGFTRLNLNETAFEAGIERTFDVEIQEAGEYAVFLNQTEIHRVGSNTTDGYGGFAVTLEKDGKSILVYDTGSGENKAYNGNYIRIGAEKSKASASVKLESGTWKLKVKSYLDNNISYIDLRSTIISIGDEGLAVYPSDYNYLYKNGTNGFVNEEMNDGLVNPRVPVYSYYADFLDENLSEPFSYGRGVGIIGKDDFSYYLKYKLNVESSGTYKIKTVVRHIQNTDWTEESTEADRTSTFRINANGSTTDYKYTFDSQAVKTALSTPQEYEKIVDLNVGENELYYYVGGANFRAYVHHIVVEPYEEELGGVTEDGAEFVLAKPEIVNYVNDARRLYITKAYEDYTTSIVQNYGLNGLVNLSDRPLPVSLVWEEISGAEGYTLYVSENENLDDAIEYSGITEKTYDVYNLYPNTTYFWKVVGSNGEESEVKRFITKDSVRFIYAEGGANIRDIGGWNGLNMGMAYRGAQPDGFDPDYNVCLTEKGIDTLVNEIKIKTDLDLRGNCGVNILEIDQIFAPIGAYTAAFTGIEPYKEAIKAFADVNNYPIYFHCAGGADRTGTVGFIVEALAGATEEDLSIDFELTGASRFNHRFRHRPAFAEFVRIMKGYSGKTLQEKVESYVMETLGLTRQEVSNIQSLLGGNKVVFDTVSDFGTGSNEIALGNLNGQTLSSVKLNGAKVEGAALTDGTLNVTFTEAGTGEIVFADGNVLKFNVK